MADYPALPLWTDAYIADTMHMGCLESGAYLHLLMAAWRSPDCTIPDDDRMLSRMARCTPREWNKCRSVVMDFWVRDDKTKTWSQKRLLKEREYVRDKSEKAKRAADARYLKDNKTDDADAYAKHSTEHVASTCSTPAPDMPPTPIPIPNRKDDAALGVREPLAEHGDNSTRETSEIEKREIRAICEAFNAELASHFGDRAPLPHPTNSASAVQMVRAGATVDLVQPIFAATLAKMAFTGKSPPRSLNYFTGAVADALRAVAEPLPKGNANGRSERRPFDPEQQRQSDRAAIAGALLGNVDSGVVAGVREGTVPGGSREDYPGPAEGDGSRTETLSPSEYRVLRGADGPADHVCADVQPAETGRGESDRAVPRDAQGFAGRSAREGDFGDDQTAHGFVPATVAGGREIASRGSAPDAPEAAGETGNGPARHRPVTDEELINDCPAFLRKAVA